MALIQQMTETGAVETFAAFADGSAVPIPHEGLFGAEFSRSGRDLKIEIEGAPDLFVADYFAGPAADLVAPNGATLRGDLVARLAGPEAPGLYAQQGAAPEGQPIGQVETLEGSAAVIRTDGTRLDLTLETRIFAGDLIETGADGRVSVTFIDGTIFTLATEARMVIDELIYQPQGTSNSAGFSLIQGGFVFIAGQVAPTGGIDIATPAATLGIRGTTGLVNLILENGIVTLEIALAPDPDGTLGRILCFDLQGNLIADIGQTDLKWVISPDRGIVESVALTAQEEANGLVLLAQAEAAFRIASARVDAGGDFVQPVAPTAPTDPEVGFETEAPDEIDSQDAPVDTAPETAPETAPQAPPAPAPPTEIEDQGSLELVVPEVIVAGLEDAEEGLPGSIEVSNASAPVFTLAMAPQNGTVDLFADGSFVYRPNANFNGEDSFTFDVQEGDGPSQTGTVLVEVAPVNDAPELTDSTIETAEEVALQGAVLATDVDGDALSYRLLQQPVNGTVVFLATGQFTYTPFTDFNGTDSFLVEVSDGEGGLTEAFVTVTVTDVNDIPVIVSEPEAALGSLLEDDEQVETGGQLVATDADTEETLTWSGGGEGEFGSFAITEDGAWSYLVDPDAVQSLAQGQTVTETTTVTVSDGRGGSADQVLSVTVTGVNDAPVVTSGPEAATGTLIEDGEGVETGGTLLASDPDTGAVLTWSGGEDGEFGRFAISEDGVWSYVLNSEAAQSLAEGQTVTETTDVTVSDGLGGTATQTLTVTLIGANDAPSLLTTEISTTPGAPIFGELLASDPEGDSVTFGVATLPQNGSVFVTLDGLYAYDPDGEFAGTDSFQVVVTDALGASRIETVSVSVGTAPLSEDGTPIDLGGVDLLAAGSNVASDAAVSPQVAALFPQSSQEEEIGPLLERAFATEDAEAPSTAPQQDIGTANEAAPEMQALVLGGGLADGFPAGGEDDPGASAIPSA